jgi:predicted dehydrogenase
MQPLRIGVVGAGSLGYHHVRVLQSMPQVRLAGFVEIRPERAAQVSAELGVSAFADLGSMLEVVDAITIAVPTGAHHAVARVALARGRHVLIEKPMTGTLTEADDLLAIAADSGALIQIGHVERFNRAIRAALPFIERPRFIQSDRLAPFSPRGADVAVVLDLMIHDLDLVTALVRDRIASISAVGIPVLTPFVDIANARLGFSAGAVANVTASRVSRERMRKVRIFQDSGYFSLDLASGTGEYYRLRGDVDLGALAKAPLAIEDFVERVPLEAPDGEPLRLEFESFVAAIGNGTPAVVSGADGREALSVALRIVAEIEASLPSLRGTAATTAAGRAPSERTAGIARA